MSARGLRKSPRHFPRYPVVPTTLLGRLAVDGACVGRAWANIRGWMLCAGRLMLPPRWLRLLSLSMQRTKGRVRFTCNMDPSGRERAAVHGEDVAGDHAGGLG